MVGGAFFFFKRFFLNKFYRRVYSVRSSFRLFINISTYKLHLIVNKESDSNARVRTSGLLALVGGRRNKEGEGTLWEVAT